MKKISVVIGTRPEAIKLAPLVLALQKEETVTVSVCLTGQHTDMVDSVLQTFGVKADTNFSIMGQTDNLNDTTALLLQRFQIYFLQFKPDIVVVQGDTVSVCTAALASFNLQIPVAHVEAGLRTNNLSSPWPEEGFRRMVTQITKWHFAPTEESAKNIERSGVVESEIAVTGNTVIDALHHACKLIEQPDIVLKIPQEILVSEKGLVLITGHRRENFGDGLDNLCAAIRELATAYPHIDFVFPVHLNPAVQKQVLEMLQTEQQKNVKLIVPLNYLEFVWLMKKSLFIITDSGGIQEEAPGLGKPVLVTRDTTERPEGVEAGTVKLVGTSQAALVSAAKQLFDDAVHYQSMSQAKNPYGDGQAVERIVKTLLK